MTLEKISYGTTNPLTITVRALRAQHEGAEMLVQLLLENGEHQEQKSLVITTEQYCEFNLTRGPITEELYEQIEEAAELCRALRSGESLLSYGANSVQALTRKLVGKGYKREVAAQAAERLAGYGLIDEERDMLREVEKCLRKLWGSKRISAHLWSKGYATETMQGLSTLLEDVDFSQNCAALIKKHYGEVPTDADENRRMIASLSRYGYSIGEIREAIRLLRE
ncbi:MAG: RecX family transcriptional regulator [Clostridia bacterium]|nr:RecX family transcriptional regulator [Clostridia bacterium]